MLVEGPSRSLIDAYYENKVKALRIVNGILNGDDTRNIYEAQVAIALLAILEHMTGYVGDARKHMNGLKELVIACTAKPAPNDHFTSMRLVNLAQMITSKIDYHLPRDDRLHLDRVLQDLPETFRPSIRSMLLELKHLSMTMPKDTSTKDSEHDLWLNKVDACGLNMHQILGRDLSGNNTSHHSSPPWRAYSISGNIFLCLFLRKARLGSTVLDYLSGSLVSVLDGENTYPRPILLWMLFLGGAGAEGRSQRQWFLARLPTILRSLRVTCWKDARELLAVFPYVDECSVCFKRMWKELEFM